MVRACVRVIMHSLTLVHYRCVHTHEPCNNYYMSQKVITVRMFSLADGAWTVPVISTIDGSAAVAGDMVKSLYHAGLMSFMAGGDPSRVRFLMPLGCVKESHIDLACQILENVVSEMSHA